MTNEQSVNHAKAEIAILKGAYINSIKVFNGKSSHSEEDVLDVHTEAIKYFNYCEDFVGNSDLLGAHQSDFWVNGFAEDCFAILESLILHYQFIKSKKNLFTINESYPQPSMTSYANMQRMIVLYINESECNKLKKEFKNEGLPTYVFSLIFFFKPSSDPDSGKNMINSRSEQVVKDTMRKNTP